MNSRDLFEFALPSPGSLFVIVDPIATVPAFLAMTPRDSREQRIKAARLPCFMVAVVLLLFAAAGKSIFKFFAIIMPAFQIAASIVLLIVVLDMLRAQRSRMQEMTKEASASAEEAGLANTRLAIPMLAGPGAISRAILLQNQPVGIVTPIVLHGSIAAVSFASYVIFRLSARGALSLNPIAISVVTRIIGLLLGAAAVQSLINRLKSLKTEFQAQ